MLSPTTGGQTTRVQRKNVKCNDDDSDGDNDGDNDGDSDGHSDDINSSKSDDHKLFTLHCLHCKRYILNKGTTNVSDREQAALHT